MSYQFNVVARLVNVVVVSVIVANNNTRKQGECIESTMIV